MRTSLIAITVMLILASAVHVLALTDEEIFRNFPFSIVNPGARSGAMGGAFIGLADDATAAEANPAGLTILTKPEISLEYSHFQYDEVVLNSFGQVTRQEDPQFLIDTANEFDNENIPSFLSVVFPSKNWTVGFSRQVTLKTGARIVEDSIFNLADIGAILVRSDGRIDQEIVNWNAALAVKLREQFSLGFSARISQLDWHTRVLNTIFLGGFSIGASSTVIDDSDTAFGFNAGLLWKFCQKASLGAVYKYSPKFGVTETETSELLPDLNGSFTNTLNPPDTLGVGVSLKPNDSFTITSDIVYIKYEDLMDGFLAGHNIFTLGYTSEDIQYNVKNKMEFHFGSEVVAFLGSVPVAVRAGYYYRPSNSLVIADVSGALPGDQVILPLAFRARDGEHHVTVGNGFVFGPHFQVDWAVDLARTVDHFVVSSVARF